MPISPEDLVMFESDWPGGGWNRDEGVRLPGPRRSGELGAHIPDAVRKLAGEPGAPKGLAELGVTEDIVPRLARTTLKDACLGTNPRAAGAPDIEALFRAAL
jgi:alcohol dehydrogenase class IV